MSAVVDKITEEFAELRCAGGHHVLLIDPPWEWETYSEAGQGKSPGQHYDYMSMEDICAMPVQMLAAKNCAAFVWVTWPLAMRWHEVVKAWGFDYAGLAWEWIKYNSETGKYAFGGGYGTRKNLEPCLLLTKGDPKLRDRIDTSFFGTLEIPQGVHSVRDFIMAMPLDAIRAPLREHSRKPDEQYDRIETLFDGRKIELFGRARRSGWTSWGREVGKLGAKA